MKDLYDVIVLGGGPGGLLAAIAAGRLGASVLLVERYGFLGGMSTAALVYPWMTFHDMQGDQVIKGIPQEVVDRLVARGASPGHLWDTIGVNSKLTPFDKEAYKDLALEMVREARVDLLLHSIATEVRLQGSKITAVMTSSPYGGRTVRGKIFVDATGDCNLVASAGGATVTGRPQDGKVQPMTMMFVVAGADLEPVRQYMMQHPEEFWPASRISQLDKLPLTGISGFYSTWKEHAPAYLPRNHALFFAGMHPGQVLINTTRIINRDPTDVEDVVAAEVEARGQVRDVLDFFRKHIPGFSQSYLVETGPQIGVRESRRLVGLYTLSTKDATTGRRFEDVIARNGYMIDIHDPTGKGLINLELEGGAYDIPYRSLVARDLSNVLVAGRAISCSPEAFASLRTTPACMAIGQAAGSAAALSARHGVSPAVLDPGDVQAALLAEKACLH